MKFSLQLILFMLLFAMVANAQSNPPTPSRGDSTTKPENRTDYNEKNSDRDKRVTKNLPAVKEISKPSVIQIESTDKTEKRRDYSSSEWWAVYFTGLLALITAALAMYTGKLYRATVNLGKDAKATADRQAKEMERSLAVAKESADQAKESVDLARQELILTQRPKLRVTNVIVRQPKPANAERPIELFAIGHLVSGQFYINNVGGTPATITNIGCWVHWAATPLPMERPYEGKKGNIPMEREYVLYPGESITIPFESDNQMKKEPGVYISRGEHWRLWVMGWIEYRDDLKIKRRIFFCRKYNPGERFSAVSDPDYESYEEEN